MTRQEYLKHKETINAWANKAQIEYLSLQGDGWLSFQELFDSYIFTSDGSPCGKLKQ